VSDLVISNLDARVSGIAAWFTKWRLMSLKLSIYQEGYLYTSGTSPASTLGNVCDVVTSYNSESSTYLRPPTNESQLLDMGCSRFSTGLYRHIQQVPSSALRLNPYKWLEVSTFGSLPQEQRSAGSIWVALVPRSGNITGFVTIIVEGVVQFADPVNSAQLSIPRFKGISYHQNTYEKSKLEGINLGPLEQVQQDGDSVEEEKFLHVLPQDLSPPKLSRDNSQSFNYAPSSSLSHQFLRNGKATVIDNNRFSSDEKKK